MSGVENVYWNRKTVRPRAAEQGSILILGVLSLFSLMAFLGLAFDVSYMFYYKRRMQTAADAGALAAAQQRLRGLTNFEEAARQDAGLNGFPHGQQQVDVEVAHPPAHGAYAGDSDYVEVTITQPQPTWFLRFVRADSATVRARAVAGLTGSEACVYALNRETSPPTNGIFANGNVMASFGCSMYSNSNVRATGRACLSAPAITYAAGSYSGGDCSNQNVVHAVPTVDPLQGAYPLPAETACTYSNFKLAGNFGDAVLTPGVYCGGIDITGNGRSVTLTPGQYILKGGGMKVNSSAALSGTGVTFFNTVGEGPANQYRGISIAGGGQVSLRAPSSGTYKGLLFFQDPRVSPAANNGSDIGGNSNSLFEGIFYFPTTDLKYAGNSSVNQGGSGYTMLIAYNIEIKGNSTVEANYSTLGGNPLKLAAFAE